MVAADKRSSPFCSALPRSSRVQFHYIAVGDGMLWSYLLSIECTASPEARELQRPSYILVNKLGDI